MSKISLSQFDSEQEQREKRKEEIKKQKIVLSLRKSGDFARLHFLLNLDPLIGVDYHFVFNASDPSATIRAVCAGEFEKPCYYCAQARRVKNKSPLTAGQYIALPVWLHSLSNLRPPSDEDYEQHYADEVGYKILMVKRGSDAVGALRSYYDEVGSIQGCDWKYSRSGTGRDDTKYTLTALPPPPASLDDLPETDADEMMRLLAEAYPPVFE